MFGQCSTSLERSIALLAGALEGTIRIDSSYCKGDAKKMLPKLPRTDKMKEDSFFMIQVAFIEAGSEFT